VLGAVAEFLFGVRIPLAPPIDLGPGPDGRRLVLLAESGRFAGVRPRGEVIPLSGGDYVRRRSDGVSVIDVRLCLRTDDDATMLMTYEGRAGSYGSSSGPRQPDRRVWRSRARSRVHLSECAGDTHPLPPATVPPSPSCCQGYLHRQGSTAERQITAVRGW